MGGGVYLLITLFTDVYVQLGVGIVAGVGLYAGMSCLFRFAEMRELVSIIRKR